MTINMSGVRGEGRLDGRWPSGQLTDPAPAAPHRHLHFHFHFSGLDHKAQTTEAGHLMSLWLSSPKSNNQKQKRQKGAGKKRPSSGNGQEWQAKRKRVPDEKICTASLTFVRSLTPKLLQHGAWGMGHGTADVVPLPFWLFPPLFPLPPPPLPQPPAVRSPELSLSLWLRHRLLLVAGTKKNILIKYIKLRNKLN